MAEEAIAIRPVAGGNAQDVTGIDATRPLDPGAKAAIFQALDRSGIVLLRGQMMDDERLAAFGASFGPLFSTKAMGSALGDRAVVRLTNLDDEGGIRPADDRFRRMNAANELWHVDNSFSEPPGLFSVLLGRITPAEGAVTEFANLRAAYDALPVEMRDRIAGMITHHSFLHSRRDEAWTDEQRAALPPRRRPLVLDVGGRGRPSLYLASHICAIDGMADETAQALVEELTAFATQPRFVYRHHWSPGDLLMYDNRLVMHRATPFNSFDDPRDMRALRVVGALDDPAFDLVA